MMQQNTKQVIEQSSHFLERRSTVHLHCRNQITAIICDRAKTAFSHDYLLLSVRDDQDDCSSDSNEKGNFLSTKILYLQHSTLHMQRNQEWLVTWYNSILIKKLFQRIWNSFWFWISSSGYRWFKVLQIVSTSLVKCLY